MGKRERLLKTEQNYAIILSLARNAIETADADDEQPYAKAMDAVKMRLYNNAFCALLYRGHDFDIDSDEDMVTMDEDHFTYRCEHQMVKNILRKDYDRIILEKEAVKRAEEYASGADEENPEAAETADTLKENKTENTIEETVRADSAGSAEAETVTIDTPTETDADKAEAEPPVTEEKEVQEKQEENSEAEHVVIHVDKSVPLPEKTELPEEKTDVEKKQETEEAPVKAVEESRPEAVNTAEAVHEETAEQSPADPAEHAEEKAEEKADATLKDAEKEAPEAHAETAAAAGSAEPEHEENKEQVETGTAAEPQDARHPDTEETATETEEKKEPEPVRNPAEEPAAPAVDLSAVKTAEGYSAEEAKAKDYRNTAMVHGGYEYEDGVIYGAKSTEVKAAEQEEARAEAHEETASAQNAEELKAPAEAVKKDTPEAVKETPVNTPEAAKETVKETPENAPEAVKEAPENTLEKPVSETTDKQNASDVPSFIHIQEAEPVKEEKPQKKGFFASLFGGRKAQKHAEAEQVKPSTETKEAEKNHADEKTEETPAPDVKTAANAETHTKAAHEETSADKVPAETAPADNSVNVPDKVENAETHTADTKAAGVKSQESIFISAEYDVNGGGSAETEAPEWIDPASGSAEVNAETHTEPPVETSNHTEPAHEEVSADKAPVETAPANHVVNTADQAESAKADAADTETSGVKNPETAAASQEADVKSHEVTAASAETDVKSPEAAASDSTAVNAEPHTEPSVETPDHMEPAHEDASADKAPAETAITHHEVSISKKAESTETAADAKTDEAKDQEAVSASQETGVKSSETAAASLEPDAEKPEAAGEAAETEDKEKTVEKEDTAVSKDDGSQKATVKQEAKTKPEKVPEKAENAPAPKRKWLFSFLGGDKNKKAKAEAEVKNQAETGQTPENEPKKPADPLVVTEGKSDAAYAHDGGQLFQHKHVLHLRRLYGETETGPFTFLFWPTFMYDRYAGRTYADFILYMKGPDGDAQAVCTTPSNNGIKEVHAELSGYAFTAYGIWNGNSFESHITLDGLDSGAFNIDDKEEKIEPETYTNAFFDQFRFKRPGYPQLFIAPFWKENHGNDKIPIIGYAQDKGSRIVLKAQPDALSELRFKYKNIERVITGHWENDAFKFNMEDILPYAELARQ